MFGVAAEQGDVVMQDALALEMELRACFAICPKTVSRHNGTTSEGDRSPKMEEWPITGGELGQLFQRRQSKTGSMKVRALDASKYRQEFGKAELSV